MMEEEKEKKMTIVACSVTYVDGELTVHVFYPANGVYIIQHLFPRLPG